MNVRQNPDFDYIKIAREVVDYSLDIGFAYTLMTIGDKRIDPWVLSQFCLSHNPNFSPIIAINPFYQHPVSAVKRIISLKNLYPSKISVNLVTGSFFGELNAVNDILSFEERSIRLNEFYQSMMALINPALPSYKGKYYQVQASEVYPKYNFGPFDLFMSGALAEDLKSNKQAYFVRSIRPLEYMEKATVPNCGLSLGIIARDNREEALREVDKYFPNDRRGEMLFSIAISNNETPWNKWLKSFLDKNGDSDPTYYLKPMKNFWTNAAYLVGTYEEVALKLKEYSNLEYKFFMVDFPSEEAPHIKKCLEKFRSL